MVKFPPLPVSRVLEAVSGTVLYKKPGVGNFADITGVAEPREAGPGAVTFVISEIFARDVPQTKASVLIVQKSLAEKVTAELPENIELCISCDDAYLGLARFSELVAVADPHGDWRLPDDAQPRVHPKSQVDSTARLGPGVVVCEGARIGARATLLANVVVGPEASVGADSVLFPGVVLYPRTVVGDRVRLHSNVVLGSDGFGYARGPQGSVKIWHLGRVVVQDDVEIGAGTTVDRGTMRDSLIERGAKIDNMVQIGHNAWVKSHAILCAQVGMAGNVTVGRGAILAGKAGIADKVEIGDGAVIGASAGISKDVPPGEQIMGTLIARPRKQWWKLVAHFERLPELLERVKKLEGKS